MFRIGRGRKPGYYAAMRKRVTNMQRYATVGLRANRSYLDALADVDDPVSVYREIKRICEPVTKNKQRVRALNPLRENDRALFEAVMQGDHHLHGFKASHIGTQIGIRYSADPAIRKRQSAQVNRKLRLMRGYGLITRYGRSRRYRVTAKGIRHMNAAIALHHDDLPILLKKAA
ncbi:MAG: hypothetical protein GF350_14665 [Chitinivibrionales bacterium]|nr:hypothetical protein [Chitinivibrionales bacterium]